MISAFGVEHGYPISKDQPNAAPTAGRRALGTVVGPWHSAVAGKKGRKLGAVGSTMGHALVGNIVGGTAGALVGRVGGAEGAIRGARIGGLAGTYGGATRAVTTNSRKGRYKPQSR